MVITDAECIVASRWHHSFITDGECVAWDADEEEEVDKVI